MEAHIRIAHRPYGAHVIRPESPRGAGHAGGKADANPLRAEGYARGRGRTWAVLGLMWSATMVMRRRAIDACIAHARRLRNVQTTPLLNESLR
jgi:hypothetical protein